MHLKNTLLSMLNQKSSFRARSKQQPYKKYGGAPGTFQVFELKAVLVSLRVFSLKRFTAKGFVVPFRALSWRNDRSWCVVLQLAPLN